VDSPVVVAPLHRHFTPAHLDDVARTMLSLGPPRIHAYLDAVTGAWFAREGTHRLRAAIALGFAPIMVPVRWWRSASALARARCAAIEYGYAFPRVEVAS
jgi:hypothetical protein